MERVVIDLELSKLEALIDQGYISKEDYTAIEAYTKEFRDTLEYKGLIAEIKVKQSEMNEIYTKLNKFKDEYENKKH